MHDDPLQGSYTFTGKELLEQRQHWVRQGRGEVVSDMEDLLDSYLKGRISFDSQLDVIRKALHIARTTGEADE